MSDYDHTYDDGCYEAPTIQDLEEFDNYDSMLEEASTWQSYDEE